MKTPNILFFFPDQWRGDWFGENSMGKKLKLPFLKSLEKRGVLFSHAYTPSPLCAPARACIATGEEYPAQGVLNNSQNLPFNCTTLYSTLKKSGYHVLGCGKFDLHKADFSWGRDGKGGLAEWGFSDGIDNEGKLDGLNSYKNGEVGPYLNYLEKKSLANIHCQDFEKRGIYKTNISPLDDKDYCDNWLSQNAINLLDNTPKDKPWFLQVNFTGPHTPFDITQSMDSLHRDTVFPLPVNYKAEEGKDPLKISKNYAAMMENIDHQMEKIFNHPKVDKDNTIIIFSSDHGELLGDHGYYGKTLPYNGSVHVPLLIYGKSFKKEVIHKPVSILDIPGTILDLCEIPLPKTFDSRSLFKGEQSPVKSALYIEEKPLKQWKMIIKGDFKYYRWHKGEEKLYRLDDYKEKNDLCEIEKDICQKMRQFI